MPADTRLTDDEWEDFQEEWRNIADDEGVEHGDVGLMLEVLKEHWTTLVSFKDAKESRLEKKVAKLEKSKQDQAAATVKLDDELKTRKKELDDIKKGKRNRG